MKTVVFAYHNMGIVGLNALKKAGFEIAVVFSHEDDPDENCWFDSVSDWAKKRGIPVKCPENIRSPEYTDFISQLSPEMIFSFYYRYMLPDEILSIPKMGAYNLHGSLLPDYRGRAPVNWVLVNGEKQTGVTLHKMVKKADAGEIVGQRVVPISFDDTALTLFGKLCVAAGELLDEILSLMKTGKVPLIKQDLSKGSYFGGRRPEDGRICWAWSAERIYNLIRAVTEPYPGAFCIMPDGAKMTLWWGAPEEVKKEGLLPGSITIEDKMVFVQAKEGRIKLLNIQIGEQKIAGDGIFQYFKNKEGMKLS
jgi:UDP-4-amino-4-deoxy-L-arabinose formyltransferase/UDP-glucuronic acid dehydrogenase (UDP-4-keto-hexauronic acid decarboxylating)